MSNEYLKFKSCPDCRYPSPRSQEMCPDCGHVYRTRFVSRERADGGRETITLSRHIPPAPKEQRLVFCTQCGVRLDPDLAHCQNCGRDKRAARPLPSPLSYSAPYGQQQAQMPPSSLSLQQPSTLSSTAYAPLAPSSSDIIQFPPRYFRTTSPTIAAFVLTGAGQMCNQQAAKGMVLLLSAIVFGLLTLGVGAFAIWLIALIDAIQIAGRLNRGEAVRAWQWF